MTTRDALLAAILANPEDDTPRLVFADHLEEQGESERAELIRVGIELARVPGSCSCRPHSGWPCWWCGATESLCRRQRELLTAPNWSTWAGPLPICDRPQCLTWDRGFIGGIEASAADWLAHGDAILAAHPVREVTLTTMPEIHLCDFPAGFQPYDAEWLFWRLEGRGPHPTTYGDNWAGDAAIAHRLLKSEWPRVRKWNLPQPVGMTDIIGRTDD